MSSTTSNLTVSDIIAGCDGFDAMTAEWFKISENILFNGQWASNKVMKDGLWDIKIPTDLKKGYVLGVS